LAALSREESHKVSLNLVKALDPRLSLAARIGWLSSILSVVLSLLAGLYVSSLAERTVQTEIGALYADRAQHIADAIDLRIESGVSAMQLAAGFLGSTPPTGDSEAKQAIVDIIKKDTPGSVWAGVTDKLGTVLAGDGELLENASFAKLDWFKAALNGASVTGPSGFSELESALSAKSGTAPRGYLFVTAPISGATGAATGIAIACFDMGWISEAQRQAGASLTGSRPVDIFLMADDGGILTQSLEGAPPPETDLSDRIGNAMKTAAGGKPLGSLTTDNYLVGFARSRSLASAPRPAWTVVVREAKQSAFAPANQTALAISLACLILGIGLSLAAAFGTGLVLRGLKKITDTADSLRSGTADNFAALDGEDEVSRISRSLAALFTSLKSSNKQLADLNRDLDRKVTERTQEVRRLSEETKNAAVTRERLRLSRDLHDTLAHSMLAMLTQVRMMRKISKSKPELLDEELGHAERAAQEGLKIAREAVTDLRYFAVRDDGLGEALAKLVRRLKERVEIEASLEVDEAVATMAGPAAETIFRIADEALRNIERHAHANRVIVHAMIDTSNPARHILTLTVSDDGGGFDPLVNVQGHFGLMGMREQAELIGGKLDIESTPEGGATIRLTVSL
jgi:signal transduction histidine kinase